MDINSSLKNNIIRELKACEEQANILKKYNAILAGGAITSLFTGRRINDFDMYFRTKEDAENAIHDINKLPSKRAFFTDNATSFSFVDYHRTLKIQCINNKKFLGEPVDIIENFDLSINKAAYDLVSEELILTDEFIKDNTKRVLSINKYSDFPIITLHRAIKYIDRGYKLPAYEQIKLALMINKLKMESFMDLKDQLQGIDTLEFANLTDALMEVKNDEFNASIAMDLVESNKIDYMPNTKKEEEDERIWGD